jgi:copper oxidase (laccase) domain-containing protein
MVENLSASSSDLYVAIGPGLQKECFEVRSDVFSQFPEDSLGTHQDRAKRFLDLSGYLNQQLVSLNIPPKQISVSTDCTKCNSDQYYSYRRDGERSGRMLGIIGVSN